MKKKQTTALLLTTLMSMSAVTPAMASSDTTKSIPSFSVTNTNPMDGMLKEANVKKIQEDLKIRNISLSKTIYGEDFSKMLLNERMKAVRDFFSVRSAIYKDNQKTMLASNDILQLEKMKNELTTESDKDNKDTTLISTLMNDVRTANLTTKTAEELKSLELSLQETISAYQDLRSSGRNLERLVETQIKVFHSSQLQVLNKFSQQFDISGQKSEALEMNLKMLQLTAGDSDVFKEVTSMIKAEKKEFFFVDNEVVELEFPTEFRNGGLYIDVADFAKITGFTVKNAEKLLVISNGVNVLVVNKETGNAEFNKQAVGKDLTFVKDKKLYVPLRSVFNLFRYDVSWNKEIEQIVVNKLVYAENELDTLNPVSITTGLFPKIQK